jgi:hypothetical protein
MLLEKESLHQAETLRRHVTAKVSCYRCELRAATVTLGLGINIEVIFLVYEAGDVHDENTCLRGKITVSPTRYV